MLPKQRGRSPNLILIFGHWYAMVTSGCWDDHHCRVMAARGQLQCICPPMVHLSNFLQVTETPEGHSRDRKRAKGMGESKAKQDAPHSPPSPKGRGSPAQHCAEQTLASRFVPFVAHTGGQEPDSFKFLFYTRHCSNSYSPFYTAQRPTCGYLFHHDTDHTRKVMDIQSANIVKWGPIPTQSYSADQ